MKDPFFELFKLIESRKISKNKNSYTVKLYKEGEKKIAQKFGINKKSKVFVFYFC